MKPTLPIDYDIIRICLVNALREATGLGQNGVIMAEPEQAGAVRPPLPYFTLKIVSPGIRYGNDASAMVQTDDPTTVTYAHTGPRGMMVSFNSYGSSHEEAYGYMGLWQASLDTEGVQAILRSSNIAVWRIGSVSDMSRLLNTGFEGRAQMDCLFGTGSSLTSTVTTIGTVNINALVTP